VEQPNRKGSQIVQQVVVVVGSLTMRISCKQVREHVQKPVAAISDYKWLCAGKLYKGRMTGYRRSCTIVGDWGTL